MGERGKIPFFKSLKCPVCGKRYIPAPEHAWKAKINNVTKLVCTYSCMRLAERKNGIYK